MQAAHVANSNNCINALNGASYNVYTITSDARYIAFVAVNPEITGSMVWNEFID